MADLSFIVDYKQIKAARAEIEKLGPTAVKAGRAFDTAFNKNLTTIKRQISFSQRLERQKKKEADVAAKAAKAQATEEERLRMKFVQGHAAMNIYTKELNDLAVARRMDIISADEQKAAVERLNASMKAGTGVFANHAAGMQTVGRGASRVGVLAQQAGYQFGDFAVQVQSGTNPMIAFGQQATQLIGTLSMLATTTKAIMFFSGLGILVPVITAVAGALMRMREESEEAEETLMSLTSIQEDLARKTQEANLALIQQANGLRGLEEAFLSERIREAKEELESFTAEIEAAVEEQYNLAVIEAEALREKEALAQSEAELLQFKQDLLEGMTESRREELNELQNTYNELVRIRNNEEARARSQRRQNRLIQEWAEFFRNAQEEIAAAEEALKRMPRNQEILREGAESFLAIWKEIKLTIATAMAVANQSPRYSGRGTSAGAGSTAGERALLGMGGEYIPSDEGSGSSGSGGGSGTDPMADLEKFLEGKRREAELERELVGLFGQERSIQSDLIKFRQEYGDVASEAQAQEFEATLRQIEADKERQKTLDEAKKQQEQLSQMISRSMENAFMSMVDGTKSVKEAFRDMAAEIIRELYRVIVVQTMVNSIKTSLGFMADGGVFSGGSQVQAYANGGVVGGPTFFPMAGGKTGLMGEAGPEAIMPLKRGRDGKLGVQAEGSGGDTINVVQNFSFQANGDESVKKLIAQAAPQIAKMTKSSLLDDRRRGGATRAAFG